MPRFARPVAALSSCLLAGSLAGCAADSSTAAHSPAVADPAAALPAGPMAGVRLGRPAETLPDPVTFTGGRSARRTSDPVVIDTRDFPEPVQVDSPWLGAVDLVKNQLPAHGRDKSLPTLRIPDRVETRGGGFQAVTPTGVGFPAVAQTPWSPPDPNIAVGPQHIVQTVNDTIAFYTKSGQLQFSAPMGERGSPGFFEGEGAGGFTFDPKCFYDHESGRFVVIVLEVYGPTESWIDIAVSDDADPNGVWHRYRTFSVVDLSGTTYWVDYPGLGFDDNAFYVTGNLFKLDGPGGGFAGPMIRVFDKAPLLAGQPAEFVDLAPQIEGSMQVAQMHGDAPRVYMVTQAATNALRLWTVNDPLGAPSLDSVVVPFFAVANGPAQGAPNLGGGTIDTLDGRIMNVHWRDGNLYTAHAIAAGGGDRVRARWYHFATNGWPDSGQDPALVQFGAVNEENRFYFFPAIASDKFGRVGMVMARSAADEHASVWAVGRSPGDDPGAMSDPVFLVAGDTGTEGRWGDYFDIALDPNDDRTFWAVGMYARPFGWQTWIGSFLVGCPADENGDGRVDFFDLSNYLARFRVQDASTDLAPPFGVVDFFDLTFFLNRMSQGCP